MVAVDVTQADTISAEAVQHLRSTNPLQIPGPVLTQTFANLLNQLFAAQINPFLAQQRKTLGLSVKSGKVGGTPTVKVAPKKSRKNVAGFFVHGGGFALLSAHDYIAYRMAYDLGVVVYSVNYSLSPRAQFPDALNETINAYGAVARKYRKVLVAGSSSGANLLITTILNARAGKADPPEAAGLFAPSVDLRLVGDSCVANDGRDPLLTRDSASKLIAAYLGATPPANTNASPIFANYSRGFVPTIITTGTRDLLQSDSVRLYWKLRDAKATVQLRTWEGMWHAFEGVPHLPEGEQNMREVFDFLEQNI
jgi:acetyl esterase/lipase